MNNSFGGDRRVKHSADFKRAFDSQQAKITSRYFIVPTFFVSNENTTRKQSVRLGVVVSKKVSKRAVERNRIKRVVRESFRQTLLPTSGVDVIVVAKRHASGADNAKLFEDLSHVWRKVGNEVRKRVDATDS